LISKENNIVRVVRQSKTSRNTNNRNNIPKIGSSMINKINSEQKVLSNLKAEKFEIPLKDKSLRVFTPNA